jgi:hypothetical protein
MGLSVEALPVANVTEAPAIPLPAALVVVKAVEFHPDNDREVAVLVRAVGPAPARLEAPDVSIPAELEEPE